MSQRKKKQDNRGLTMVEVLVALVIATIVVGAIWQFTLTSIQTYREQKQSADFQVEVQQTMNQMQNLCVAANRGVAYYVDDTAVGSDFDAPQDAENKTLEIYSADKAGKFIWNKDTKEVVYEEYAVTAGIVSDVPERAVLAEDVVSFAADVSGVEAAQSMKLKFLFEKGNHSYEVVRNITFRNSVQHTASVEEIYEKDKTAQGASNPTVLISNAIDELEAGHSYGFQAIVANSKDTSVIWTVLGNQSSQTTMNVSSGLLTIGEGEPQDNVITVVATLASDRNVSASHSVKILEQPPFIVIEQYPKYVLCGEQYELKASVKKAEDTGYSWSLTDSAGNQLVSDTRIDGNMLIVSASQEHRDGKDTDLVLKASANMDADVNAAAQIKVREPEFEIKAVTAKEVYLRGETVSLSTSWLNSYVIHINEYDDTAYKPGSLDKEPIIWKAYYWPEGADAAAKETVLEVTAAAGEFPKVTIPLESTRNGKIYIEGTSERFPQVSAELELSVSPVSLRLIAAGDGTDLSVEEIGAVEAFVEGYASTPELVWTATYVNNDNKLVSIVLDEAGKDGLRKEFTATEPMKNKDVTITVKDPNSGEEASVVLPIKAFVGCSDSEPEEKGNFLVFHENTDRQTSFTINVPTTWTENNTYKIDITKSRLYNETTTSRSFRDAFLDERDPKEGTITFVPDSEFKFSRLISATYHAELKKGSNFNKHILHIALYPSITNCSYPVIGADYESDLYLRYHQGNLTGLLSDQDIIWESDGNGGKTWKDPTVYKYLNFYGLDGSSKEPLTYTATYNYRKTTTQTWYGSATEEICQITICDSKELSVTLSYHRRGNGKWDLIQ